MRCAASSGLNSRVSITRSASSGSSSVSRLLLIGGGFYYGYDGESNEANRYIQITLSSGGIATKYEPNVAMSPTEESAAARGTAAVIASRSTTSASLSPTDSSPEKYDLHSKGDRRKSRELLKGAAKRSKRFFFGKKKSF